MPLTADLAYYRQRHEQACERACLSPSPEARHVHLAMAQRYAELIEQLPQRTSTAREVSRAEAR